MLVGVVGLSLPSENAVGAVFPWLGGRLPLYIRRTPRGSEPGWVIFHIRDMSLTGLYVSLSVFLVTIVLRKQGLCRHFAFHGMFHAMLVQRKHTTPVKCRYGLRWLHLTA